MTTVSANPKRLYLLLVLLAIGAVVMVVRWRSLSSPTTPPRYATVADKIKFYNQEIKEHPEDRTAYLELGKLEESQEFYISALRKLRIARALGVPDRDLVLPMGRSLSHLARWDDARAELDKAVKLMPDSVEAAANLAGVYYSSGDGQQASAVLNDFVRRHRSPNGALNLPIDEMHRLMLCYAEARDSAMAGVIALDILKVDPKDTGAYSIAGHAHVVAGRYKEAMPYLEKATALDPNVAELCYHYGTALEVLGRESEALSQFQRCVMLNPNATDAYLALATVYEKHKNWKLAAIAISNAALHSKSSISVLYRAGKLNERAGNKPESDYWYSNAALLAGQYTDALKYASRLASSGDPTWHAAGLSNMADAYHGSHKMKEYLKAVKQGANHGTAQDDMRLAAGFEKVDLLEKQVEYLKRAMAKDPTLAPEAHFSIAENMLRRGLRDEAEAELVQAVAGDPKNPGYHSQLGKVYLERRDVGDRARKAVAQFEQVVRLDPKSASGYQDLGIACAAANDFGHAAAYLEHAIDLQPGYGPSYEELGRVYAKMGDKQSSDMMLAIYRKYVRYDQTLKTLVARADQNAKDTGAQVELADVLVRAGDYGSALDRYNRALKLKPGDTTIRRKYDGLVEMITRSKADHAHKL